MLFSVIRQTSSNLEGIQKVATTSRENTFKRNEYAPDLSLESFTGENYKLSEFKNKAIVLYFWATWCPICVDEIPQLQKIQDKYKRDLEIIGIHRSDTEKKDVGSEFAKGKEISYLMISDSDGKLYRATGGIGMPVTVFIDKKGEVVEIKIGPKTSDEIAKILEKIF